MKRAMIWKEIREGIRYAVLAALLMAGGAAYAFWQSLANFDRGNYYIGPLFGSFLLLTTVGCPVVGFALGLLSFIPESRRDRWAFLVHRPVPRTSIFWSKVVGAAILYTLGTALPLAAAIAYAAVPGHFAYPFLPRMTLPAAADFAGGFAYLFAGALVAMRQAGWIRTRLLPVGVAVLASLFLAVGELRWAIGFLAFITLLLGVTAWGLFRAGGEWRPAPAVAKVGLYLTVGVGLAILGGIAFALVNEIARDKNWSYSMASMSQSGHVYRVTHNLGRVEKVTEPDGRPAFDTTEAKEMMEPGQAQGYTSLFLRNPPPDYLDMYTHFGRMADAHVRHIGNTDGTAWYFFSSTCRIVGYDRVSRLPVESLGPDGFHTDALAPSFPPGTRLATYGFEVLVNPAEVYHFNLKKRVFDRLLNDPAADVHDATITTEGHHLYILVSVGNDVRIFRDGLPFGTLPIPHETATLGVASPAVLGKNQDRFVLWQQGSYWTPDCWNTTSYATTYSLPDGRILTEQTVPPIPMATDTDNHWVQIAPAPFVPLLLGIAAQTVRTIVTHERFAAFFHDTPWWAWVGIAAVFAGAFSSAALTWWIATRHAFTPRARLGWTILNFLFGLASLATMLAIRDWPALVLCPKCRHQRATNTDQCVHCGAPWGDPSRDGTEVFEPQAPLETAAIA